MNAPAVAGEVAVRPDGAVAGDQDRDGVGGARRADGARGPRLSDPPGDLTIGTGLPRGDGAELVPDAGLERRRPHVERKVGVEIEELP